MTNVDLWLQRKQICMALIVLNGLMLVNFEVLQTNALKFIHDA